MDIKVFEIGRYASRNYILETPDGVIVVDTGYQGGFPKFRDAFEKRWPLSNVRYIFMTHHHDDHAGFLGELMSATDAPVVLHKLAIEYLATGKSNEKDGAGFSSFVASLYCRVHKDFSFPPVVVPQNRAIIVDSEECQPFEERGLPIKVLCLPGHTDDSIGLYLSETGAVFCGDAAMNAIISRARHTIYIEDAEEFGRSWDRMLALNPAMIYPTHGNPFPPSDLVRYRNYLKGRSLRPPRR